jgi:LMBR1 domain-containing protein 1
VGVNIYLLIYYSHPDDQGFGDSIYPKIIVVLGLTLAFAQILILPLDVSNARGDGADFRVDIFWQIVLIAVACYIVFLAPFSLFLYEADDEETCGAKLCHAIKMEVFVIVILAILFIATYFFFNEAKIPLDEIKIFESSFSDQGDNMQTDDLPSGKETKMELNVSFAIYIIALFSWIGWYVLVLS